MSKQIILSRADYILLTNFIRDNAKNFLDNNLKKIVNELHNAKVVDVAKFPENTVKLNSQVSLLEAENSNKLTLTLVMPTEADINKGKISVFAPLSAALIGYKVGDEIELVTSIGVKKYKIQKVKNK